jgi:hypothetical protein
VPLALPPSPIGEGYVRRYAPRSFDYAQDDKVGCVCFAKDFSTLLEMTERSSVWNYVKKPLSQHFGVDSSPFGGGAENEVIIQKIFYYSIRL